MKHLVRKEQIVEITVSDLFGNELIAYKCKSDSDTYAILVKLLHGNWGFVPLNNSNSNARYVAQSWTSAIEKASENRKLKVFNTMREMLNAMVNSEF